MSETESSSVNAMTYELEKYSKNRMIIFNHEYFLNDDRREGTSVDADTLKNTFTEFKFQVTVHNNLDKTQLLEELKQFGEQDFTDCGCVCVAILTHGNDHGYLEAHDEWYTEREVFACFSTKSNLTLAAKPIIVLIQACRGPNLASPVPISQTNTKPKIQLDNPVSLSGSYFLPTDADIIIFYSSFFGRASARAWEDGTWFIRTLCDQIRRHAATEHLEKISRRVKGIVALEKEFNCGKQMPMTYSTLLRKLFLVKHDHEN